MKKLNKLWENYYLDIDHFNVKPLKTIMHVTHLRSSYKIIKGKKIKANLVNDNYKLKIQKTLATFTSPNGWPKGSRYGNVSFEFNFKNLLAFNPNIYWIGYSKGKKHDTCTFLLSKNEYEYLERYDPKKEKGPLLFEKTDNTFYWNTEISLHILIDKNLSLNLCKKISFVPHNDCKCNVNPNSCKELSLSKKKASIRFLSTLLSSNLELNPKLLTIKIGNEIKTEVFDEAISRILQIAINHYNKFDEQSLLIHSSNILLFRVNFKFLTQSNNSTFLEKFPLPKDYQTFEKLFFELLKNQLGLTNPEKEYEL